MYLDFLLFSNKVSKNHTTRGGTVQLCRLRYDPVGSFSFQKLLLLYTLLVHFTEHTLIFEDITIASKSVRNTGEIKKNARDFELQLKLVALVLLPRSHIFQSTLTLSS